MFYRVSDGAEMRKSAEDRKSFNDIMWDNIAKRKKVKSMTRAFSFHHEISTDGVATLVLFSRL